MSIPSAPTRRADLNQPTQGVRRSSGQLLAFVAVTFLVSWGWMLALALSGASVDSGTGWPTHLPALLGPLVGAVLVTGWTGGRPALRDLVARMVSARCAPRWWAVALSPIVLLVAVIAASALGWTSVDVAGLALFPGVPASWGVPTVAVIVIVVNGFGEETGWRGFAQPLLQRRHGPLVATLFVAGIWALWHAPMFPVLSSFRSFGPLTVAGWCIGLLSGAVVLAWLYNRSGGSILLVAVWHGGYNLVSATAVGAGYLGAAATVLVIVAAFALVVTELVRTHSGRSSVLLPQPRTNAARTDKEP